MYVWVCKWVCVIVRGSAQQPHTQHAAVREAFAAVFTACSGPKRVCSSRWVEGAAAVDSCVRLCRATQTHVRAWAPCVCMDVYVRVCVLHFAMPDACVAERAENLLIEGLIPLRVQPVLVRLNLSSGLNDQECRAGQVCLLSRVQSVCGTTAADGCAGPVAVLLRFTAPAVGEWQLALPGCMATHTLSWGTWTLQVALPRPACVTASKTHVCCH